MESSKDRAYDAAAQAALGKAAPFDPWPPEVAALPAMEIRFLF